MAALDLGAAAFLLVWGMPFLVAGRFGAWRPALLLAALPVAGAGWGLIRALALDPRAAERAAAIDLAGMALVVGALCAAHYAAGCRLRPRGGSETA